MQYYRENANWLERTYDFVPRIGIDALRACSWTTARDIAARLDARLQRRSTPTPTRGGRRSAHLSHAVHRLSGACGAA